MCVCVRVRALKPSPTSDFGVTSGDIHKKKEFVHDWARLCKVNMIGHVDSTEHELRDSMVEWYCIF